MSVLNPYAQGGWGSGALASAIPSIQGALPHLSFPGGTEAKWVTFRFVSRSQSQTDVFNCVVVDPESHPRFSVSTSPQNGVQTSLVQDASGGVAARIEWQAQPIIELRTYINHIPRQAASHFVSPSPDGRSKSMVVKGKTYQWSRSPQEGIIRWSNISYNPSEPIGALFKTSTGTVCLSVAPSAIAQGLLDVAVLVTVLFSSGATVG